MISVIVPVYNVEKYLDKCIQSILNQTYRNFELILVDDGSTDNSGKMCDEYSKKDKRIKVIHKENGGLSDARNCGTNVAKGTHVTYIDSDDYVSEYYLKHLYILKEKYNTEMSALGIQSVKENEKTDKITRRAVHVYSSKDALKHALYQDTLGTSACGLLIPIDIALKFPFPLGKYHEDDFTTYKYFMAVDSVAVCERPSYFYLQRENSITHRVFGKSDMDELESAQNYLAELDGMERELLLAATSKAFSNYCQVAIKNRKLKCENPKVYKQIDDFLKRRAKTVFHDRYCRNKNRIAALIYIVGGIPMLRFCFNIFKMK